MKIKLNKEYTNARNTEIVKDAIQDFRNCFTADDLCRMYEEEFGTISGFSERKIIEANIEAFSSNDFTDDVSFSVELTVKIPYFEYHELRYYIDRFDGNYIINSDEILHEDRVYKFH